MLGNTKIVESTTLKELYITQHLSVHSESKKFTRHFTNAAFYLEPSDYTLLSWIVYYSDSANVFTYSAELLRMYDKASDRAIEIYGAGKIQYKTSMSNARKSFISLVEKGLFIKLSAKGQYMINPYVVYSSNDRIYPPKKMIGMYLDIVSKYKGDELSKELTKMCDGIQKVFKKELLRTNIKLRQKK